jgi:hypothetical protein
MGCDLYHRERGWHASIVKTRAAVELLDDETAVGSPVCEWVVPWLCCAAPPAARDLTTWTRQTSLLPPD